MNFVDLSVKCGKTEYKEKEILSPYSRKDSPKHITTWDFSLKRFPTINTVKNTLILNSM